MSAKSSSRRPPRRGPGRPSTGDRADAREALLDAAARRFAAGGTTGFTVRAVAAEAGVTPALVNYYFGGKEGLYEALLARTAAAVLERVRSVVDRDDRDAPGGAAADRLGDVLDVVLRMLREQPWLPTLVVREVLVDNGRFRDEFVRSYASQMAELVPGLMQRGVEEGRFRDDLDPRLAFLSFLGMTIFPFLARPVVQRVLSVEYDDEFLRRFAAHTRKLFFEGARA